MQKRRLTQTATRTRSAVFNENNNKNSVDGAISFRNKRVIEIGMGDPLAHSSFHPLCV